MRLENIKKVLILGSGGLKIGQAGEFDYSGSQAIKALKEEDIEVVLLNPNIATVQTDPDLANKIYFLPITAYFAEKIIAKERPDGILLGFGGQTALNVGLELADTKVLEIYGVRVLGTPIETIRNTEDRGLFVKRLKEIQVKIPNGIETANTRSATKFAEKYGYPLMLRSSFVLGGACSDVARNQTELTDKLQKILAHTPKVLIEEYLQGWKEIEYEIVRDQYDNCIAVCNMENMDPMGIHTGESIVVAPSQTLNNREYHFLRSLAVKTVRHLGIIGECNIQFAVRNDSFDYKVIEINARLSRSSALASKATGYPLARIAAKLSLGYGLHELTNPVTKTTPAFFEPALDYITVKIPRWDFDKFKTPKGDRCINSEMKSVGEVMAIGRKFEEALQKAIRMLAIGAEGLAAQSSDTFTPKNYLNHIKHPTDLRIFAIAEALKKGVTTKKIGRISYIHQWFLEKIKNIIDLETRIKKNDISYELLSCAKRQGFSDKQIGILKEIPEKKVRSLRKKFGIRPCVKQIDTLAGEFPAQANYFYLTYNGEYNDVTRSKNALIVLGGGPYSIGSSVEFDWCAVQTVKKIREMDGEAVVINCNPETVSTDFDISNRLYFEELTLERILDIYEFEKPKGIILYAGGQIPNNLALKLNQQGVKILGTKPESIDLAEDRHKFSSLLDRLHIDQPPWVEAKTLEESKRSAKTFGYPVIIRPSYVLSGTAMSVAQNEKELERFLLKARSLSTEHPVVISQFIKGALEVELDGVSGKGKLLTYLVSEHVENAGTHSGDATIVFPPQKLSSDTERTLKNIAEKIVKALVVHGPFNIQFLIQNGRILVIECNLRASRTFPFISKAAGVNLIEEAAYTLLTKHPPNKKVPPPIRHVAVKSPQFSHSRIKNSDPLHFVEMTSTGEVASFGSSYGDALLKAMMAADFRLPQKNILVSIRNENEKRKLLALLEKLKKMNFFIYSAEKPKDALTALLKRKVDFIIDIPSTPIAQNDPHGYRLRRLAIDLEVPLISNAQIASDFINALCSCTLKELEAKESREY